MWQLKNNKLQVATSLKKRGWKGGVHCCLCGKVETTNHVFFECSISRFIDHNDLMGVSGNHGSMLPNHLKIFVFAGIAWAIWRSTVECVSFRCCFCAKMAAAAGRS